MTTNGAWWAVGAAIALAGCQAPEPSNAVRVSGHVEATEIQIAPDVGGRLLELRPAEGDRVAVGDLVARLDARDVELQIVRARAERVAADAQVRFLLKGARPEAVRQARAQTDAAAADTAGAAADAAGAAAELAAGETDLARFEALLAANAGSQKQRDDARARVDVARERVRAAQERVQAARERVQAAREAVANLEAGATREEVDAARALVSAADAQIAILEKARADATVVSAAAGIVTARLAETGEIVAPRMPLVVVTDLDHAWANLFVPEPLVPRIMLGQPVTVLTDAGDRVSGKVAFISPQAEFTPRSVQTSDERAKLVYRIKVSVDNRAGTLKVGMPVDAELALP
jgi:HlyD family secretion protein